MAQKFRKEPLPKSAEGDKVISLKDQKFRISFEVVLTNGYELSDMTMSDIKEFHRFISDTVYKGLTVREVDALFLRKEGLSNAPVIKYHDAELLHYGKARNPFRIFGYYNKDGYFVVCRIDGRHQTNNE